MGEFSERVSDTCPRVCPYPVGRPSKLMVFPRLSFKWTHRIQRTGQNNTTFSCQDRAHRLTSTHIWGSIRCSPLARALSLSSLSTTQYTISPKNGILNVIGTGARQTIRERSIRLALRRSSAPSTVKNAEHSHSPTNVVSQTFETSTNFPRRFELAARENLPEGLTSIEASAAAHDYQPFIRYRFDRRADRKADNGMTA